MANRGSLILLAGFLLLNLAASICFKEGGTDSAHRLHYFIGGNVLGISSTALMMGLYKRMNVNLAMVLGTCGSSVLVQLVFWRLYHTPLTGLQVAGIALTIVGTAIATGTGSSSRKTEAT
jgi:drug/metabolite transporter (DMT)-like permease